MIYFISDIHLGFYTREKEKQREDFFLNLLNNISKNAEKIYFLGDIFDYWFDYKTVIPKDFYRTLAAIDNILRNGIQIEYLKGNHDFGHRSFFKKEFGIEVYDDDITRYHNNKKFFLSHGDGKNPNDKGYIILKKILRNKLSLKMFLLLHPDFGVKLASNSSQKSRIYTDNRDNSLIEPMKDFAFKKIDEGYDYVIMGHRHKLFFEQYKNGYYVNLGSWFIEPHIATFDGENLKLIKADNIK